MAGDLKERYVAAVVGVLVVFLSSVAVAFAYYHTTNGVYHGLGDQIWGYDHYPIGATNPNPANPWSTAEVRHYFPDGSFNVQCASEDYGAVWCQGTWGSEPCRKRYVGGAVGYMTRHWVRRDSSCPGQIHA